MLILECLQMFSRGIPQKFYQKTASRSSFGDSSRNFPMEYSLRFFGHSCKDFSIGPLWQFLQFFVFFFNLSSIFLIIPANSKEILSDFLQKLSQTLFQIFFQKFFQNIFRGSKHNRSFL